MIFFLFCHDRIRFLIGWVNFSDIDCVASVSTCIAVEIILLRVTCAGVIPLAVLHKKFLEGERRRKSLIAIIVLMITILEC